VLIAVLVWVMPAAHTEPPEVPAPTSP
jgi:hypothetical protein